MGGKGSGRKSVYRDMEHIRIREAMKKSYYKKLERERLEAKRKAEFQNLKGELEFLKIQQILKKLSPEETGAVLSNSVTINDVPIKSQEITINYGEQKDQRNKESK